MSKTSFEWAVFLFLFHNVNVPKNQPIVVWFAVNGALHTVFYFTCVIKESGCADWFSCVTVRES